MVNVLKNVIIFVINVVSVFNNQVIDDILNLFFCCNRPRVEFSKEGWQELGKSNDNVVNDSLCWKTNDSVVETVISVDSA